MSEQIPGWCVGIVLFFVGGAIVRVATWWRTRSKVVALPPIAPPPPPPQTAPTPTETQEVDERFERIQKEIDTPTVEVPAVPAPHPDADDVAFLRDGARPRGRPRYKPPEPSINR